MNRLLLYISAYRAQSSMLTFYIMLFWIIDYLRCLLGIPSQNFGQDQSVVSVLISLISGTGAMCPLIKYWTDLCKGLRFGGLLRLCRGLVWQTWQYRQDRPSAPLNIKRLQDHQHHYHHQNQSGIIGAWQCQWGQDRPTSILRQRDHHKYISTSI